MSMYHLNFENDLIKVKCMFVIHNLPKIKKKMIKKHFMTLNDNRVCKGNRLSLKQAKRCSKRVYLWVLIIKVSGFPTYPTNHQLMGMSSNRAYKVAHLIFKLTYLTRGRIWALDPTPKGLSTFHHSINWFPSLSWSFITKCTSRCYIDIIFI